MKVDFCLDKNLCFYKKIFSAEKINPHFEFRTLNLELIIKSFPIIISNFKKMC